VKIFAVGHRWVKITMCCFFRFFNRKKVINHISLTNLPEFTWEAQGHYSIRDANKITPFSHHG